jgi:hypothetical protein
VAVVPMETFMKPDQLPKLRTWLAEHGAELLSTTNPWEQLRWRYCGLTMVLYRNKSGRISFSATDAENLILAFLTGKEPKIRPKSKRRLADSYRPGIVRELLLRDGEACIYCNIGFSSKMIPTIEHFVARAHNGPEHLSNLALACPQCNAEAGVLPVVDKIKLILQHRGVLL